LVQTANDIETGEPIYGTVTEQARDILTNIENSTFGVAY